MILTRTSLNTYKGLKAGDRIEHPERGAGAVQYVGQLAYIDTLGVLIAYDDGTKKSYVWNSVEAIELDRLVRL
jgi:hypothetical protein